MANLKGKKSECSVDGSSTASPSGGKRMVALKSSDGDVYQVEEKVVMVSQVISQFIDDVDLEDVIPLYNVSGQILGKVLEFCKKHVEAGTKDDELEFEKSNQKLKKWQAEYVNVDMQTLLELTLAANYLDIKDLLALVCEKIADRLQHMSVEEVREVLNIENDYSEEEEEQVRNEIPWAFQ